MSMTRRKFIIHSVAAAAAFALWQEREQKAHAAAEPATYADPVAGPFKPSWDSLQKYQCPDWFRDAKFGIWAHWDAQCIPEAGSWYARNMYTEGSGDYQYQVEHYGHPSKVGFKDIDHLWKAENWDPEHLIGLYKAAGAKYFVALANHHDNFDCYDSKHQPWNSVAIGPKKDIVGGWEKVVREAGLRFGVSSHGSRAWAWYETSQGADSKGPLAGVPYDGHLTKADGKGTWWEGLDPQDLYAQDHKPMGFDWNWANNGTGDLPSVAYREKFYNRIVDLVDKYHPDLLYFDDTVLPLYQIDPTLGLNIAAHHYNASIKRNGGKLQAILNGKQLDAQQEQCLIQDYERGASDVIRPHPWQTDTCIGGWFYNSSVHDNHGYKTPDQVIKTLMDIVSKNGNLLLSIPVKGDGTIDADEVAFLHGMAAWMNVNQEAVFSTRPWKVYGEGPVKVPGGGYNEAVHPYSSKDIRFTTKGGVLYATALGWPDDGKLTVRTLGTATTGLVGNVTSVALLGSPGSLPHTQTADGLVVTMPAEKPCDHAYVLKIEGLDLAASMPVVPPLTIRAAADGTIMLSPFDADLHGKLQAQAGDVPNIGYWDSASDTASWTVHFDQPGSYAVSTKATAQDGDTAFVLDAGSGASMPVKIPKTDSWYSYEPITGGVLKVASAGDHVVTVRAADPASWKAMNLGPVMLTRTGD